jgi:drug/metabolite transporter (DMT)-like permease
VSAILVAPIVAACAYGFGAVLQTIGAQRGGGEPGMRGLAAILRQLPYLWGLAFDLLGWVLTMYAVRRLPLFTVQTTLASSLAVTALLGWRLLGLRLRRVDVSAIGVIIVGLVLVGVSAADGEAEPLARVTQVLLVLGVPLGAFLCLRVFRAGGYVAAGAAAGLMFALSAMCARAVESSDGIGDVIGQPIAWAVAGYAIAGLAIHARSLEGGQVGPVTAAMWSTEIIVATSVGFLVLGDRVRSGWAIPAVAGILLTLVATRVLATSPVHAVDEPVPAAAT